MRLFHCPSCSALLFFENSTCLRCQTQVGFDPISQNLIAVAGVGFRSCTGGAPSCNWLVLDTEQESQCLACRSTTLHPDPAAPEAPAWNALERAKRRLLQTLLNLGLPPDGLRFAFPTKGMTGHADGLITVVLAEADDTERLRRQRELGEPYRTLIGHLRHESGHYFHGVLVLSSPRLAEVRAVFGDEQADYSAALAKHYKEGARADWQESFVSSYASAHPHEDWAETWAHYLHMVDALEIAGAYGMALAPQGHAVTDTASEVHIDGPPPHAFEAMLAAWYPLTWFANSLNRSLGHQDWYPFVISPTVVTKLKLVHDLVHAPRIEVTGQAAAAGSDRTAA